VRREVVKRRVGPALDQALEPGDRIIAGTLAVSGYSPAWDLLAAAPAIASGVAETTGDRGLRLNVHARWGKDLDEVLAALQTSGAAVEGAPGRSQYRA
jgi:hypothetical protein